MLCSARRQDSHFTGRTRLTPVCVKVANLLESRAFYARMGTASPGKRGASPGIAANIAGTRGWMRLQSSSLSELFQLSSSRSWTSAVEKLHVHL